MKLSSPEIETSPIDEIKIVWLRNKDFIPFLEGKEEINNQSSENSFCLTHKPERRQINEQTQTKKSGTNKLMPDPSKLDKKNNITLARRVIKLAGRKPAFEQEFQISNTLTPLELFGIRMGILRRQRGYSIEELAERSVIDPDVLFAIEVGQTPLGEVIPLLEILSSALQIDEDMLSRELIELLMPES